MQNPITTTVRAITGAARTDAPDRAYRLHDDEYVPDGMRRIARGQLADAHEELSGASKRSSARRSTTRASGARDRGPARRRAADRPQPLAG